MLLRSWVQIPPGPLFPVVQIRYWFELVFGYCPTKSLASIYHDNDREKKMHQARTKYSSLQFKKKKKKGERGFVYLSI